MKSNPRLTCNSSSVLNHALRLVSWVSLAIPKEAADANIGHQGRS